MIQIYISPLPFSFLLSLAFISDLVFEMFFLQWRNRTAQYSIRRAQYNCDLTSKLLRLAVVLEFVLLQRLCIRILVFGSEEVVCEATLLFACWGWVDLCFSL